MYSSDPHCEYFRNKAHSDLNGHESTGEAGNNIARVEPIWKHGLRETIFGSERDPEDVTSLASSGLALFFGSHDRSKNSFL
jgi:hypothetical protein